jgi:hypothetical protein
VLAAVAVLLVGTGEAESAKRGVAISGRAYAFNHMDTFLAGATIRVRELPGLSATTDAHGDYVLEVPDNTNVTPYIDPPPGYHQIDLQTFHPRGEPIENANFQTPGDAEYNGLAALLQVPFGPDGRPEQCAIVTTASKRDVRGVDYDTFHARTPHGVAGATAHAKPALPAPTYFNENVIPDRSQPATSGDGGIIWTEVPAGTYRVITKSPSTSFASFLATCEPGRIVNANPPWGAYQLSPGERPLGAGVAAGSIQRVKAVRDGDRRLVAVRIDAAETLRLRVTLRQDGGRVGPRRKAEVAVGNDRIRLRIAGAARRGKSRVTTELVDGSGGSASERFRVRVPAPR